MDRSIRRHLVLAAVLVFVALLGSGSLASTFSPSPAHNASAAPSDANASFEPPDLVGRPSKAPPILLAGEPSNLRAIYPALLIPRPNGYCVTVTDGATGVTPYLAPGRILGFSVAPGATLAANVPPGSRTGPLIVTTATHAPLLILGSSPAQYCLQIIAPVGYTSVVISWTYQKDAGPLQTINLEIPVANVTLAYTDGRFSGAGTPEPARVCTEGWGWDPGNIPIVGGQFPFFLTGAGAMAAASPEPNVVVADNNPLSSDWDWTGAPLLPASGGDYYELHSSPLVLASPPESSVRTDHFEHCIALVSTATGSSQVTFQFGSIYQPGVVAEALPAVISDTAPATVTFTSDATRRLRNIGPAGQMLVPWMWKVGFPHPLDPASETSETLRNVVRIQDNLVRNSVHTACVTQTIAGSVALSNFTATPPLQSASLFTAGPGIPDLQGAACVQWTYSGTGPQSVFYSGPNASAEDHAVGVRWNNLHFTELTDSQFQSKTIVTNSNITRALTFNLGNGTFASAPLNIVEWVYGDVTPKAVPPATEPHPKAVSTDLALGDRLLSGALIRASISSQCGGFGAPNVKSITGHSAWGRFVLDSAPDKNIDDLRLSVTNDPACGPSSTVTIQVDVFYPDDTGFTAPATAPETLTVTFRFTIPSKQPPRFAWAGQQVTITYAVSGDAGACRDATVKFVRAHGQPGNFLPGPGVTISGPDQAIGAFGSCSASVVYESEDPGEVDIEAFIQGAADTPLANAGPFSKIAFPIYYMLLEDVKITATPTTVVSEPGDVSAAVRGYFLGTNPSGRLAETKADGRTTPADRWMLPDDYDRLRGSAEFRPNWPGSAPMPPARVTFLMQNEGVRNNYATGVKNGAVGWFLADDVTDILPNINPLTNQPSALGTVARPRILSELSDTSGNASVDTFGDFNLGYEACAKSPINGNPLCKPDDVVGHTTYYAVADYPFAQRKFPPIISNNVTTEWTWFGYKSVTVVNTENPQIKYVVAHLRDRDGFCDAVDFNNVLGVPVRFEIDAGGGTIIEAADRPYTISANRRFAVATTFDIRNDLNQPMNTDIAKTSVSDDECQAWIKVSNSLLQPSNVTVTFPAPPSPVPGNVRVTGLTCTGAETITVTNQGTNPISLAGFSFLSPPQAFAPFEYFGLDGHLAPGQSLTFPGGPAAPKFGWLFSGDRVFANAGGDYVSLVWDGFEIDRVFCDGRPAIHNVIPASFPLDPEGEIIIETIIPFGTEKAVELVSGWNLLTAGSTDTVIADAIAGKETSVNGIYLWDEVKAQWGRYIPGAPGSVNNISKFEKGKIYWVQVNQPFTLTLLK